MRKGVVFLSISWLILCAGIMLLGEGTVLRAQDVDPFYRNLLQKGESAYLAGNYDLAIRQLETSSFGLLADKKLRAKALIYLSLCHYFLKDTAESEKYLTEAVGLISQEEFEALGLENDVIGEISGLAARFGLNAFNPPVSESVVVGKPDPDTYSQDNSGDDSSGGDSIEELEKSLAQNPGPVGWYYRLYDLYMKKDNKGKARDILQRLIQSYPDEIYGLYLLGWIHYRDKKYKVAEEYFREALRPRPGITPSEELAREIRTYLILSVYHSGDKQKALDMMSVSVNLYTEARIRELPLPGSDKATLRQIIREYVKR